MVLFSFYSVVMFGLMAFDFDIISEGHQKYFGGGRRVPKTTNKVIGKMPPVTMMGGMGGLSGLSSQPNSFTGEDSVELQVRHCHYILSV